MDHFYQLPMLGAPDDYMLECYTLLAALARETSTVRLSALVTGNTYRNPAVLAKTVTTLDIVSGGRAQLGIGAGWFELEHDSFGIEFGTFTDRFEKLEEALQIIIPMLRGERPSFDGRHYTVRDAINSPPPCRRIPVMIGGGGERRRCAWSPSTPTSRTSSPAGRPPAQARGARRHCERSAATAPRSPCRGSAPRASRRRMEEAEADARRLLQRPRDRPRGCPTDERVVAGRFIVGDPDTVGERLADLAPASTASRSTARQRPHPGSCRPPGRDAGTPHRLMSRIDAWHDP